MIGCRFRYCAFWSGFFIPLCVRFPHLFSLLSSPPLPPFLRLPRRLHSVLSWNCCRQLHTLVTCDFIKRRSVEVMNITQVEWRGGGSTKRKFRPFLLFFFHHFWRLSHRLIVFLRKAGTAQQFFIKACGVGWGGVGTTVFLSLPSEQCYPCLIEKMFSLLPYCIVVTYWYKLICCKS